MVSRKQCLHAYTVLLELCFYVCYNVTFNILYYIRKRNNLIFNWNLIKKLFVWISGLFFTVSNFLYPHQKTCTSPCKSQFNSSCLFARYQLTSWSCVHFKANSAPGQIQKFNKQLAELKVFSNIDKIASITFPNEGILVYPKPFSLPPSLSRFSGWLCWSPHCKRYM